MRDRSSAPLRRFALAALLALGASCGLSAGPALAQQSAPASGSAAAPAPLGELGPSGDDLSARASSLADDVVKRWAALQLPDGRFPDPMYGDGGDYGTAMLGLAMARRGVQQRDGELLGRGLDALVAQATIPAGGAFELLTLSRALRWADHTLPTDPVGSKLWAEAEPALVTELARRGPMAKANLASARCYADVRCYNNLKVVTSLGEIELAGTGLAPSNKSALLANRNLRAEAIQAASARVAAETGSDVSRTGESSLTGGGILSDPPRNPLAYHALSTMILGELIEELGPKAPRATLRAFDRAARALLVLAGPDGDISYFGRGQGQVWVPAVVTQAAALAATHAKSHQLRGRYLALAEVSLTRLRTVYGVGVGGFPLVPGALDGGLLSQRAVDAYATTRAYNGLAVDALDRATKTLRHVKAGATATTVPSQRPGVVRSPKQAGVATITRGDLWAAIASKSRAYDDARYGAGLLMLQRRDAAGDWSQAIPGRPFSTRLVNTLAVQRGDSTTYVPSGNLGDTVPNGVKVVGPWARPGNAQHAIDFGTSWLWRVLPNDTVEVAFRVKTARKVLASGLVGDGDVVRRTPTGFIVTAPDGNAVSYSLTADGRTLHLGRSRRDTDGSAFDSRLTVAQITGRIHTGDVVRLQIHSISAAPPVGG